MYAGFPLDEVTRASCPVPNCVGALRVVGSPAAHIHDGHARCSVCRSRHSIEEGVLRLLDRGELDEESIHELETRDIQATQSSDFDAEDLDWHQMELVPTMRACEPVAARTVLELGAGTGRYSVRLAASAKALVAVDFSIRSLQVLAKRLDPKWNVALVQADCTRVKLAPRQFDLALCTLVSNLPNEPSRRRLFRIASKALREGGRFVFSTHHFSASARWRREPRSGYYRKGGIYRHLFSISEIKNELRDYFNVVTCHPIRIPIPFAGRLRVGVAASRLAEHVWPLNRLGELLLVTAREPRPTGRAPAEDVVPLRADALE